MARITVEDCLDQEPNRFALVQLASKRTKQLLQGASPRIGDTRGNKAVVTALREIADGQVRFMTEEDMRIAAEKAERDRALAEERRAQHAAPDLSSIGADLFKEGSEKNGSSNGNSKSGDEKEIDDEGDDGL